VINLLLAGSLNFLWSMLHTQQIVVLLPLNDVSFPGNASYFYSFLLSVAAFDLIPTDDFFDTVFSFKFREPVTSNFGALGYETTFFIRNLGNPFLFALGYAIALLLILLLKDCKKINQYKSVQGVMKTLQGLLLWNSVIRFVIESYMLFTICALINLAYFEFGDYGSVISGLFTILFTFLVMAFPIWVIILMIRNWDQLSGEEMRGRYGSLYEDFDLEVGRSVIIVPVLFMVRRIFLCSSILFLQGYPTFQIHIIYFSVIAVIITHG